MCELCCVEVVKVAKLIEGIDLFMATKDWDGMPEMPAFHFAIYTDRTKPAFIFRESESFTFNDLFIDEPTIDNCVEDYTLWKPYDILAGISFVEKCQEAFPHIGSWGYFHKIVGLIRPAVETFIVETLSEFINA